MFLAGLLFIHGAKTHVRNFDWESEYSIFMAGLKVNQRNAKLFNNVGHALEGQGNYNEALYYFQKAVKYVCLHFHKTLSFSFFTTKVRL